MSEGNLLDQRHHHHGHQQKSSKLFSSRDSELELLDTTTPITSSPEIRSRSQSVGSAHREALLFFEQHRLFQTTPDLDFEKDNNLFDCELRSISSCSRTSSPDNNRFIDQAGPIVHRKADGKRRQDRRQHQQQSSNNNLCHQQQVQPSSLRQQSDSNLLESSTAATTSCGVGGSGTNLKNNSLCFDSNSGRARSQSQGQCGSVRRKADSGSNVVIINTTNKKGGESKSGASGTAKASKWLEEIQFTAQYQHYRTNNYASVVSSASSLDKSDGGTSTTAAGGGASTSSASDQQQQHQGNLQGQLSAPSKKNKQKDFSEAESRSGSSSKPTGSSSSSSSHQRHRHHSHQLTRNSNQEGEARELQGAECFDDLNRQNSITTSQCWNFPRVKLRKLFTAKSLDDILGRSGTSSTSRGRRKTLQVASASAQEEEVSESNPRSSSSPEIVCRKSSAATHTKKAQLLRDNKLSLPRYDDKNQLLIVKPVRDGSKSPGAHSSKSAIVISSTSSEASKQRKVPSFIKVTRQKSRSVSALTSVLLSRVPGHSSSSANSPCSSTTSSNTGLSIFFKRSHQDKNVPPVIPAKKSGHVPCAKSDNCLNRIVASATCAKFVDYFSETSARVSKSATSTTTLVEPFLHQDSSNLPGTPSSSSATGQASSSSVTVVTAQPRKWTAIKNKWDQKLQASGDRQKEIGASLASVSNNAQIFRKAHHHQHHQQRQRSSSLSPLDNPDDGKSIESLLEITSPSPTLQEVRFLDTPEIRYASPIAVRVSRGEFSNYEDDEDSEPITEVAGANNTTQLGKELSSTTVCSSDTESCCSECKDEENDELREMTRHHGATGGVGGGTKRSRDPHHHRRHHGKHGKNSTSAESKEKPMLVVANVSYLQRPMSPGLLLRESSPSSSGTVDTFSNLVEGGGANLSSSSVIRNNNVFSTNNTNINQPQANKSHQAKLEFLKSFAPQPQHHQRQPQAFPKRDPLCANTSIVNVNERSGALSMSISPSSSGGASEKDNRVEGTILSPRHTQLDDLQDPFNRQRALFADVTLRSSTGDPLVSGGCGKIGATTTGVSRKSDQGGSAPRGAEHCGGMRNQSFLIGSSHTHHQQGAMNIGGFGMVQGSGYSSMPEYGSRSTDNQSSTGRDPGTNSSGGPPSSGGIGGETSFLINQGPAAVAQSNLNNNLYIDVDFEGGEETMGDLQSPQYVKRTAHMFDSRFSSEPGATEKNGRNPSYLNVSKSVSGYSCLTYNNGSETVSNRTVLGNGTTLMTAGSRGSATAATRLKTDFAIHSPFSRKAPHTDEDSDHSSSQSATSPPPSLPPVNTTSSGRFSESSFFQNGMNRGDDLMEETPYIPSHGKSFIMQRIERLYGTDALTNKGVLTRKSSHVTTISITRESSPLGTERIIPIKVEPRDDHENNLYNSDVISSRHEASNEEQCLLIERKSSDSGGIILPEIVSANKEDNIRHIQIQHRRSQASFDDTDEDEDGNRARCLISPTKIQSPTSLDNSGHLNGNANPYGNGVSASSLGKLSRSAEEDRLPLSASPSRLERTIDDSVTLDQIIHTNGNHHKNGVDGQDCTPMKKALSRESSAESDDTNGCSENSLELSVSDVESKKSISRKGSQDNSLYSNRGVTSPIKPKPKPKPKDMALLRTLSRSPALKTENLDKTAISLSIVQHDAAAKIEDIKSSVVEDQIDGDNSSVLSHIKNSIVSPITTVSDIKATSEDKENTLAPLADEVTHTVKKDGNYFLNEMDIVRNKLLQLSEYAAKELDEIDPSEDRAGSIHAAIGKANLLVKKKFKQFEELCNANLKGKSGDEPETTDEDLGGFWDMVMIQVEQVYCLFEDLKENNQEKKSASAPNTPSKVSSPKRTVVNAKARASVGATPKANTAAAKARDEARRRLLAEKRKAMKNQMQETQQEAASEGNETEVQIFAPETTHTG
ncbi:unnamed protein product [Orchesella dallaii]|uniref:Disks large-associated protein 1 n=1 Tax=Orchesella dallaii TaxID=48710 RepID=A0ABP1S3J6_9HEXA